MTRTIIKKITIVFVSALILLCLSCVYQREYDEPQKMAFLRSDQIWTVNVDGSDMTQLTFNGKNGGLSWSGDGSRILFHSDIDGNNEIFVMNSDGSGQRQLTFTSSDISRFPTWMPDGKIIYCFMQSGVSSFEILSADGNYLRSVAATASPYDLSVSIDSHFAADADGPGTITVTNLTDGSQTVVSLVGGRGSPQWSSDGTRVFYHSGSSIVYSDIANPGIENIFYTAPVSVNYIVMDPSGDYLYYSLADGVYRLNMTTLESVLIFFETGISEICIQGRPR